MNFTVALIRNIEKTYTYAFAKNTGKYDGKPESFDSLIFFTNQLKRENPFQVFMELDHYAFQRAKNDIIRYEIPYTEAQERQAKIYHDVTEQMKRERSDTVSLYIENLDKTGVVLYKPPYVLTTEKTLFVTEQIHKLPYRKITTNIIYENNVSIQLKNAQEQYKALQTCLKYQISCLIGGAGTGKSFVTASIIEQLQLNGLTVAVLAPTHKAREALQNKLGNIAQVKTIHSFVHNPTSCEAIVIDESGMLSTPLFAKIMEIYNNQQLIFVGDKNQIPPIEYGRPFEIIQERFVSSELKENKRSESADIIALGREILGIPQNANMPVHNIQVVDTVDEAFKQGAEVALSFTNNNVQYINESRRIKNGQKAISPEFSIGDVIVAKTNEKGRFYNGQIYEIISWNRAQKKDSERIITFKSEKDLKGNFDLAYGLTIHKSQGSEWDVVAYQPSSIDTQNLAYVAVTRAKKKLIIIGNEIKTSYRPDREWRHVE
ncbi:exodeoxyribonuclease V alpha subunit [Enterococcus sp. AZ194]|uniref:ATP-dependent DNA helicase n=1 Tax=Enterococcus sp. AZ194 TaxID=2774629 RepID=UPI003F27F6EE